MRTIYTDSFAADLDAIADFIRPNSPERAVTFIAEIAAVCHSVIVANPLAGHRKEDFGGHMYSFVARGRLVFYSFEPAFNRITFRRVIKGQDMSWRDLED